MGVSWQERLASHQHSVIYSGAFSQPQTLFPQREIPHNPMHLVTQRDTGTGVLSEGGGNVCLEGVVGHMEGVVGHLEMSLQCPWRGQR